MRRETRGSKEMCRFLAIIILICEICFTFAKTNSSFGALETGASDDCRIETATYGEREVCAPIRLEGRQPAENVNSLKRNTNRKFFWYQTAYLTENPVPNIQEPVSEEVCTETEYTVYGHTAIVQFIQSMDGKKS